MPEGYQWGDGMARQVDIATAARELGTSESAIKKRLQRGSLPGDKDDEGRWYVLLPVPPGVDDRDDTAPRAQDNGAPGDTPPGTPPVTPVLAAYQDHIDTLKARVTFLEGELAARTEELQRKDVLLMALVKQQPALPERVDSGMPPSSQPAEPTRRPWWRFWE